MSNMFWIMLFIFGILFFERLIYTLQLKEPKGRILDKKLCQFTIFSYILIAFLAFGNFLIFKKVNYFISFLSLFLYFFGIFLRRYAITTLGSNWSIYIRDIENQKYIKSGIYKYFKHPYYLSITIELLGLILFFQSKLAALVFCILQIPLLIQRIKIEDKFHIEKFGILK